MTLTVDVPLLVELGVFVYLLGLLTGVLVPKAWRLGKRLAER